MCCCTAYDEESFRRQAFLAGMDSFVTKPVSSEELQDQLKRSI